MSRDGLGDQQSQAVGIDVEQIGLAEVAVGGARLGRARQCWPACQRVARRSQLDCG